MNSVADRDSAPYPWQDAPWRRLWTAQQSQRLPHALLLTGPIGSGLTAFAQAFATALLCERPDKTGRRACGDCRSCTLIAAGNHPDLIVVAPEAEGKPIRIDQVRALSDFVSLSCHYGRYKIALVDPADAMNRNAANSLLKTLEEPPAKTLILLVSSQLMLLPFTIRSRCQRIRLDATGGDLALRWVAARGVSAIPAEVLLRLADFGPQRALELSGTERLQQRELLLEGLEMLHAGSGEPVAIAERWLKIGIEAALEGLIKLVEDLIELGMLSAPNRVANQDLADRLARLAATAPLPALFAQLDRLASFRRLVATTPGIAALNLLEEITINWVTSVRG